MKEVLKDAANASMLGAGGATLVKAALITSGFSSLDLLQLQLNLPSEM